MEYLPPERHELWKSQLARGCVDSRDGGGGRPAPRLHTRRVREIADGGGRVRHRRVVPRASHRAVSARDGARASRPRSDSRGARRTHRADTKLHCRAWRRQPEEHSAGRARPGVSRRRVRVVRRPGVRSGLLPQSSPVEDAVGAVRRARAAGVVRRADGSVSAAASTGSLPRRSRSAPPNCCLHCSSRASTASRLSNT